MPGPVYYDTCVFAHALNPSHPERDSCAMVLDASKISWAVRYGELSRAELQIGEYIQAFETHCALSGVDVRCVPQKTAEAEAKNHRDLKKRLEALGFGGKDWKHLMSAVVSAVRCLLTADRDYWSPSAKATRKNKSPPQDVLRIIQKETLIQVSLPSAFLDNLSSDGEEV